MRPPNPAETARVDNAAILALTEVVHAVERVTEAVDVEPPALLKSGGVGVRDLKRLAAHIGRSVWEASCVAGARRGGRPRPGRGAGARAGTAAAAASPPADPPTSPAGCW